MPSPSFTLDAQLRFHDKWLKIDLQVSHVQKSSSDDLDSTQSSWLGLQYRTIFLHLAPTWNYETPCFGNSPGAFFCHIAWKCTCNLWVTSCLGHLLSLSHVIIRQEYEELLMNLLSHIKPLELPVVSELHQAPPNMIVVFPVTSVLVARQIPGGSPGKVIH